MNPIRIREDIGPLSAVMVDKEGKLSGGTETVVLPTKAQELLALPGMAAIRIIKAGWSINKNYYDTNLLKEMVSLVEKQGPIQFANHLEEDDKTALNRGWEELVSYTKLTWYDEATQGVYAIVKFPKEKVDTGWIFSMIQEDPEMVGVSVSMAVYVTEDWEGDGGKGNKIDSIAWFDSADYVLWPSAGGVAVAASDLKERILKAKESKKVNLPLKKSTKEQIEAQKDKFELLMESVKSFTSGLKEQEAYAQIQAVVNSLGNYLSDCWWNVYYDAEEGITPEMRLAAIKEAFDKSLSVIQSLALWKDPTVKYEEPSTQTTQESQKMTLAELMAKDPQAYAELQKEAVALAQASVKESFDKQLTEAKEDTAKVVAEKAELAKKLDEYEVKEKVAKHKEEIETAIKESAIDAQYITPIFRTVLETEQDMVKVKEYLEDRKKLVAEAKPSTTVHTEQVEEGKKVDMDEILKKVAQQVKRK